MEKSNQVQQDNGNLSIYERVRCVPKEAKKEIEAGRLKGKHDINPMWRIKALTEVFGPAGFGWYTEIIRTWTEASESGEMAVFVDINLFVKKDGEWSRPIFGNGGNKLIANEKKYENGQQVYIPYLDDDAYKKAYTDAISVAAKALGVGADVYFEKDKGKYASEAKPAAESVAQAPVKPILSSKGRDWKAAVAFTASQSDSAEVISEKIRSKYDITDDDLELLLKQSGKKS
jgi:hypothetical protein